MLDIDPSLVTTHPLADEGNKGGNKTGTRPSNNPAGNLAAPDGSKPAPTGTSRPRQLETVIGFSDGRDFTARVGPRAAATPSEGRFASAVATTMVASPRPTAAHTPTTPAAASGSSGAVSVGSPRGSAGSVKAHGADGLLLPRQLSSGCGSGSGTGSGDEGGGTGGGAGAGGGVDVKPQLREFVNRIRKEPLRGPGSLYEQLPPPSR